jgi:dihydropteroate synthase
MLTTPDSSDQARPAHGDARGVRAPARDVIPPVATLARVRVGVGLPVVVMGAINVSPESFFPGSVHPEPGDLAATACRMVEAGAALIDVGARSTAPYLATDVSEAVEAERLARAVEVVARAVPAPISADTTRPAVARAALDAGARIVNDVSGLRDRALAALVRERGAGVVLVASPGGGPAGGTDPVAAVSRLLAEALHRAREAGIADEHIVLDPGIGFFREEATAWHEWDVRVLAGLGRLAALGRPLAVGVSRKSFVEALTGRRHAADRLAGSIAATAAAVLEGAALIRAHDVAETVDAVRVAERIRSAAAR